jgi:MoaA/NifB/PqqE/SkfB family radical SAM enzyme
VDLTNRCNLRCVTCLHSDPAYHRAAQLNMSDRVIERLRASVFPRARSITVSGSGEAVLHPRFEELLADSSTHDFLPILTTNATLLDDRRRRTLVDNGAYAWVSFDAASPDLFEQIRVGAKQRSVIGHVEEMIRYSVNHPNERFCVCFVVTLQRRNIRELPDIVRLAGRMGVEQVFAHHVSTDMIPHKDITLDHDPELSDALIEEAFVSASEVGIYLEAPEPFSDEAVLMERLDQMRLTLPPNRMTQYHRHSYGPGRRYTCSVPWCEIYFKVDGRARFCCLHHEERNIGSLEENEFEEIWLGPHYRELRSTVNSDHPPRYCHPSVCQVRSPAWHGGRVTEDKDGLVFTSRYPNRLCYALHVRARPVEWDPDLTVLNVRLVNTGDTIWLRSSSHGSDGFRGRVTVGLQLYNEKGRCLQRDYLRLQLERDVLPGETIHVVHVEASDKILGRRFKVDLVDEGICWFEDSGQNPCWLDLRN